MKAIIAAAAIVGVVLISGKIDINLEHHTQIPNHVKETTRIFSSYSLSPYFPFYSKRVDVYLQNEMQDMGYYYDVSNALQQLGSNDKAYFHIAGYGGSAFGEATIRSAVQTTKAKVTMLVEGPAFSAHAYLALTKGTELVMSPGTYLMMHYSTILNMDCGAEQGLDRGISKKEKCEALKEAELASEDRVMALHNYLTTEEIAKMREGHDLYFSDEEINRRKQGNYSGTDK